MKIVGLTGGIAMGKSTIARQFAVLGAKLCSADAIVHALMEPHGKAYPLITRQFPEALEAGTISRQKLGKLVFQDAEKLKKLEQLLHPLVREEEEKFARRMQRLGAALVLIEIPLLFETEAEQWLDATVTVTAPVFLRRQRALRRAHMSEEKLKAILARQLPDAQKRRRADFVIHTGLGKAYSFRKVQQIVRQMLYA